MTKYKRDTAFSEVKDLSAMGQKLDAELDVIGNKLDEIVKKVGQIVNDDGSLKALVTAKSLTGELSLGIGAVTEWAPDRNYLPNQMVFFQDAVFWCTSKHRSNKSFPEDSGHWQKTMDFAPYIEKVAKLANSSHVARVSGNMELLVQLAEHTGRMVELSAHIGELLEVSKGLPSLTQLVAKDGNVVLQDVYAALPEIYAVHEAIEDVIKVSMARYEVVSVGNIISEIKKLVAGMDDVRVAAKAISNLKLISKGMEGMQREDS